MLPSSPLLASMRRSSESSVTAVDGGAVHLLDADDAARSATTLPISCQQHACQRPSAFADIGAVQPIWRRSDPGLPLHDRLLVGGEACHVRLVATLCWKPARPRNHQPLWADRNDDRTPPGYRLSSINEAATDVPSAADLEHTGLRIGRGIGACPGGRCGGALHCGRSAWRAAIWGGAG